MGSAIPLLGLGQAELEAWAMAQGQAPFRGRQLHDWLYTKGVRSLEAISVLPKGWREALTSEPPPRGLRLERPLAGITPQCGPGWHDQIVASH